MSERKYDPFKDPRNYLRGMSREELDNWRGSSGSDQLWRTADALSVVIRKRTKINAVGTSTSVMVDTITSVITVVRLAPCLDSSNK
jgi:hypothetical protein